MDREIIFMSTISIAAIHKGTIICRSKDNDHIMH